MKRRRDWKSIPFQALITRALAGDDTAFTELYDETSDYVAAAVRRLTDNEADVQDILQEAYLVAFRKLDMLKDPFAFPAWVRTIAVHITIKQLQGSEPLPTGKLSAEPVEETAAERKPASNPQQKLDREESRKIIRNILDGLSEEQRTVLELHYVEGLRLQEIAELLQCPLGTVKTRLHYGRYRFRNEVRKLKKQDIHLYGLSPLPSVPALLKLLCNEERVTKHVATASGSTTSAASSTVIKTGRLLSAVAQRRMATAAAAVLLTGGVCLTGGVLLMRSSGGMEQQEPQLLLLDSGVPSPVPADVTTDRRIPVPRDDGSEDSDTTVLPAATSNGKKAPADTRRKPSESDSGTNDTEQPDRGINPANGGDLPGGTEQGNGDVTLAGDEAPDATAPASTAAPQQSTEPQIPEERSDTENGDIAPPMPSAPVSQADTGSGEPVPAVSPATPVPSAPSSPSDAGGDEPAPTVEPSAPEEPPAPADDTAQSVELSAAQRNYAAHNAYLDEISKGNLRALEAESTDDYVYNCLADMTGDGIDELIRSYDTTDDQTVLHAVDFYTCSVEAVPASAERREADTTVSTVSYLGTVTFTRVGAAEECRNYDLRRKGNAVYLETLVLDRATEIWTVTVRCCSISDGCLVSEIVSEASFEEYDAAETAYYEVAGDYPDAPVGMYA